VFPGWSLITRGWSLITRTFKQLAMEEGAGDLWSLVHQDDPSIKAVLESPSYSLQGDGKDFMHLLAGGSDRT
jgi:hypothetical protein